MINGSMKQLPRGMSSLKAIKEAGFLYVDKTQIIHQVINGGHYNFFARPRRFGKSLLISTLKEIFSGNKELFSDLWIGQKSDYIWQEHPIIHIDFSNISQTSPEVLEKSLCNLMERLAAEAEVELKFADTSGEKFSALVRALSFRGKVVILIDEYDAALTSNFNNKEIAEKNRTVLREFYGVIKGLDEYIRFVFITGVSKFTKTSLFSGLNNLNDLSFDPFVAALVGYTNTDIEHYLLPYVDALAVKKSIPRQEVFDTMRDWYNGYHFSADISVGVYNPFSIFEYLAKQELGVYFNIAQPSLNSYGGQPSYLGKNAFAGLPAEAQKSEGWFESATPTFLIELLKKGSYTFEDLNNITASRTELNQFDLETISLVSLMYQTGYLTIESYSENTHRYYLRYPNKEVTMSLADHLLGVFLHKSVPLVNRYIENMRQALYRADVDAFCAQIQALLTGVPYSLHIKSESYYHAMLQVLCTTLGFDVHSELVTSIGRADLVIEMAHLIVVFEFKFNKKASDALAQIHYKRYVDKYKTSGKKIILAGVNFKNNDHEIGVEWLIE